ncbi:MAG TPA: hypothetical protein DCP40_14880 [Stenotrophomonas sp.]|nr:hypothetical protein [Stenotrophomonas sp.]
MQVGVGQVTLAIEGGVGQMNIPASFQATTRGQRSVISGTNIAADADAWVAAGDLLRVASTPDLQCFELIDRVVLLATDIATGAGRDSLVLPYGLLLDTVANGGIYATLTTAQASGTPLTVDVNRNGTSILATKMTFDNSERTTATAATPPVLVAGGAVLAKGDEITFDVDQIGTAGARGLRVYLVGQRAS